VSDKELKQRVESTINSLDQLFKTVESILKDHQPMEMVETFSSYDVNGKFLKGIRLLLKELTEREVKLTVLIKQIYEDLEFRAVYNKDGTKVFDISRGILEEMQEVLGE
jgi:hypothetical protein